MTPVFERLSGQYAALFCEVDTDRARQTAGRNNIRSLPTFQVWVGGRLRAEVKGANANALEDMIARECAPGPAEPASPADDRVFFLGQVEDAIEKARREHKVFVCFLYTEGVDSHAMSEALNVGELRKRLEEEAVVIALPDSMDETQAHLFRAARQFRRLYPTPLVPSVAVLSSRGQVLAYQQGTCSPGELTRTVSDGLNANLASAMLSAVSAAGGGASAPAPARPAPARPAPAAPAPPAEAPKAAVVVEEKGGKRKKVVCDGDVCRMVSDDGGGEGPAPAADAGDGGPSGAPAAEPPRERDPPAKAPEAVLKIRQGDGAMLQAAFAPGTPLSEVVAWIAAHRTDGGGRYFLERAYPRATLSAGDLGATLAHLQLDGRAQLTMRDDARGDHGASVQAGTATPRPPPGRAPAHGPDAPNPLLSMVGAGGAGPSSRPAPPRQAPRGAALPPPRAREWGILDYLDPFSWAYWLLGAEGDEPAEDGGRGAGAGRGAWAGGAAGEARGNVATLRGDEGGADGRNEYFGGDSTTFLGRDD